MFDTLPESFNASILAPYRDLRTRARLSHFVVEGELAVTRLLASDLGWELHSLVGTRPRLERLTLELELSCPKFEASHAQLRELTGFDFHRGVLAAARRRDRWGISSARLEAWRDAEEFRAVVAHRIADPANLGAIARNARAFGASFLCVDAKGADPLAAKALRASAGQVFDLPTLVYADLDELLSTLKRALGCELWAASLGSQSEDIAHARSTRPSHIALCIGNEGEGLDEAMLSCCERRVHIVMNDQVDSLNAAAASAVLLYALRPS